MVNNQLEWSFVGVLHEFIWCNSPERNNLKNHHIEGNYYVDSGKTGARSNDPEKYSKDAKILENAFYEAEKNNNMLKVRYSFYTAQSYRDSNQKEKAIEWYKKRISFNDWNQEVYFSYFTIGRLYYDLNEIEKAIYYWLFAYDVDPERYEAMYEVISHFRKNGKILSAYEHYLMIKNKNPDLNDKLFAYYPIYNFLLDYEMIFVFHSVKKYKEGLQSYHKLFAINELGFEMKINTLDNFIYYLDHIELDLALFEKYFNFLQNIYLITGKFVEKHYNDINKTIDKITSIYDNNSTLFEIKNKLNSKKNKKDVNVVFTITTCKRYDLFTKTMNSFLMCCKDIELIDHFICIDDNSSKEDRANMLKNYPFIKYYFKKEDEKGHLISMNMIWDKLKELKPTYWIHLEDDWKFIKPTNYIQKSIDFLEKYKKENIHQILFNKNYGEILKDYELTGGKRLDNQFLLHIKDEPNITGRNCAYWPHYSFRPSMILTETVLSLGDYSSENVFFEMDYAKKWNMNGYKSGFFNKLTNRHIGKLTHEKNKENSYTAVFEYLGAKKMVKADYLILAIPFTKLREVKTIGFNWSTTKNE
jgi:hypothetical protein